MSGTTNPFCLHLPPRLVTYVNNGPHPSVRIVFCFTSSLLSLQLINEAFLLIPAIALLFTISSSVQEWRRLVKSNLLLLLALVILLAYAEPGDPIGQLPFLPTFSGIYLGLCRALQLIMILGILSSCLNKNNNWNLLLAGLYCLLRPLQLLKISFDSTLVRLLLILAAISIPPAATRHSFSLTSLTSRLIQGFSESSSSDNLKPIYLEIPPWSAWDMVVLVFSAAEMLLWFYL